MFWMPFAPPITGAFGAVVSTVIVRVFELPDVLPAASRAVARYECAPSATELIVTVQLPPVAVAVPRVVAPSRTVTVAPASAVPQSVTVLVFWVALLPPITGAFGATVSTVIVRVLELPETLPAASVAFATYACAPSATLLIVTVQFRRSRPWFRGRSRPRTTSTTAFASAVPVSVTVLVFCAPLLPPMTGAAGAVVSTVMVRVFELPELLPAASRAVAT